MLRPSPPRTEERIRQSLEHREETLHLPTLAIKLFRPVFVPEGAVKAAGNMFGVVCRTPTDRRDDAKHAKFFEQKSLVIFAVETTVAGQGFEAVAIVRFLGRLMETRIIRGRPDSRHDGKTQMSGRVDHRPELRKSVVFPPTTLGEIAGDMTRLQPGGINRRQLRLFIDQPAVSRPGDDGVQQAGDEMFFNKRLSARMSVEKSGTV